MASDGSKLHESLSFPLPLTPLLELVAIMLEVAKYEDGGVVLAEGDEWGLAPK